MMRHDLSSSEPFPNFAGSWSVNKGDEDALLFSRMDELENYLHSNGKYVFK